MCGNNRNGRGAAPERGFMALCAVLLAYCVLGAAATVPSTPVHAQSFSGLGFLPGGNFSQAFGVSADGTVVVGESHGQAFRWTQAGGMVGLGDLTGGTFSEAQAVNADGTVVAGRSFATSTSFEAFRWTQAGGMVGLGFLPGGTRSQASGVNADGTVVVGSGNATGTGGNPEAFRWTQAGGMAGLGFLPGGRDSQASGVNADGTVVVGGTGIFGEAFRWTQAGGMAGIGVRPGGSRSEANGVNADGTVVVGAADGGPIGGGVREAFRWTQAGGIMGLGSFPPGGTFSEALGVNADGTAGGDLTPDTLSQAFGVNADGTVVVGFDAPFRGVSRAFRWTQTRGLRTVKALLTAKGVSTAGWTLYVAQGVSADGQVIVGTGLDPSGRTQGWIARLGPIPFLAFSAQLAIHFDDARNHDSFNLNSNFTVISTASNGIKPLAEAVKIQVGTFATTIPPGSFRRQPNGSFTFAGVIHGVRLQALIRPTGTLRYAFNAAAAGASLNGTNNPVQVTLTIGDDSGRTSVRASIF